MTNDDLIFLGEAIRSMRFMMASAIVAAGLSDDHKQARKYMERLQELNDKIDALVKKG